MAADTQQLPNPRWNRIIKYNSTGWELRVNFPDHWPYDAGDGTTSVTITKASDGSSLLAATAATMWHGGAENTLSAAAAVGASTIVLTTSVTGATRAGDLLVISDGANGRHEVVEVEVYASGTKTVTLTRPLQYAHASGETVHSRCAWYLLNTSTVATWAKGLRCKIKWTTSRVPASDVHELAEVRYQVFDTPGLQQRIQHEYPTAWALTGGDDYGWVRLAALDEFFARCKAVGHDANDLMDLAPAQPVVAALYNAHALKRGGDRADGELKRALEEFDRQWSLFAAVAQWFDEDQDDVEGTSEVADLEWYPVGRNL